MMKQIGQFFISLFLLLLGNANTIVASLRKARGTISRKNLIKDLFSVCSSAGMILLFQVMTFFIFVKLPQGKDIIMVAVDDLKNAGLTGNLWGLILGTIAWSAFSEFAVRYAIYVTDNSGNSLSAQRVVWRKTLQQSVADIFLLLPYFIIIISLLIN